MLAIFFLLLSCAYSQTYSAYRFLLTPTFWRWSVGEITLYSDVNCTKSIAVDINTATASGSYRSVPSLAFDGNPSWNWGGRSDGSGLIWVQIALSGVKPLCAKVLCDNPEGTRSWTVQGYNVENSAFYSLLTKPVFISTTTPPPATVLTYPSIYIPPQVCSGVCASSFRVRQKYFTGAKWYFSLFEFELYADAACTQRLPYSFASFSVSAKNTGVESSGFDGSTSTQITPWSGPGGEWAAVTFSRKVSVQCVRVFTSIPTVYIDAANPVTGEWTQVGDFGVTPNSWSPNLVLTYPADQWSDWSPCSQVCNSGTQTRTCITWKSSPGICPNDGFGTSRVCNTRVCDTRWSAWSPCSRGCGGGIMTRTCIDETPTSQCVGSSTASCNNHTCLPPTGTLQSTTMPLGATIAGESPWTIRITGTNFAKPLWPARFYTATCGTLLAVSWTEGVTLAPTPSQGWNVTRGHVTIFQASSNGTYTQISTQTYNYCKKMHGLDYSEDCTQLYVLCRGPQNAPFNQDLVPSALALFPFKQNYIDTASDQKDYMYIYRITNGALPSPNIWIVSKAIRGWEYGNNLLKVHKPASQFLSFVLKTGMCVIGQPTNCHEGSTFMQVDVLAQKIVSGDPWGCAAGHTITQRMAYNRLSLQSIEVCGTDGGYPGINHTFGVWSHRLDTSSRPIAAINRNSPINPAGGPGGMTTFGRGFVATIVTNNPLVNGEAAQANSIGLVFLNENGTVIGSTKWLSVKPAVYVNYANVATLPNGNLLVGWAEMTPGERSIPPTHGFRVAEFDSNGVMLTQPIVTDRGWGSADNWDTINGNPVWVWTKGSTLDEYSHTSTSSSLMITTYVSVQAGATAGATASATQSGAVGEAQDPSTAPTGTVTVIRTSSDTGLAGYQVALIVLASVTLVVLILVVVLVTKRSPLPERA